MEGRYATAVEIGTWFATTVLDMAEGNAVLACGGVWVRLIVGNAVLGGLYFFIVTLAEKKGLSLLGGRGGAVGGTRSPGDAEA